MVQIKADTAARVASTSGHDRHAQGDEFDARVADDDATLAESDAASAIDFAEWAVDNARVDRTLGYVDARVYASQEAGRDPRLDPALAANGKARQAHEWAAGPFHVRGRCRCGARQRRASTRGSP